ncbi:Alginate lyase [Chitinophaga jiangningensis]|uniref:Alginate lyase n=1 Tax=Chitinophaga jiangningensis TaxID=1419482 RepID=A0A1M7J9L0_9BACT|nr:alginate lyase family protein [Chitinophaga jiangningensis]SHM49699.1 Alginate lyase [Chitinophaga jiangningensis]
MKQLFLIVVCTLGLGHCVMGQSPVFAHPGLLHSAADLQRMKAAVAARRSPIYEGYKVFENSPFSKWAYQPKGPLAMVGRNPTVGQTDYDSDANAAYQNAVMWAMTGDQRYAQTAIRIVDAWSNTLQSITGKDAILMAGLGPFKMVNAAEILRYTNAGWSTAAVTRTEQHFLKVIYPVLAEFAPFANGNWDDAALKTVMAIGIFCNDREIFEKAVRYYVDGWGNGSLTHYIINDYGQVQETGRDQAHTQLGIGMLAECCEMAWHQGLDLYGYADNRLLKGFEYTAKYNLGDNDIAYTPMLDRTGKYAHSKPSELARGNLRAVYEQVYNHYVHRRGLAAPFTQAAADKLRPEGPGLPGADHPGYGTLFFSIDPVQVGNSGDVNATAIPAGLVLAAVPSASRLTWVGLHGVASYVIKRATQRKGPYVTIGTSENTTFYDSTAKKGTIYYYTVSGVQTAPSLPVAMAAGGLPLQWQNTGGTAQYDGSTFKVEAGGTFTDTAAAGFNYTYRPLAKRDELVMQVLPQPSSQFTTVGIMIRADTSFAAFMLYPGKTKEIEAPGWKLQLFQRLPVPVTGQQLLQAPAVTYGRLTGTYWIKVTRAGTTIRGFGSYDGITWNQIASLQWPAGKPSQIGVAAASNIDNTTTVRFRLP